MADNDASETEALKARIEQLEKVVADHEKRIKELEVGPLTGDMWGGPG